MSFIKKFFLNLFIFLVILSIGITFFIYRANKGYMDEPIKKIIEFYFNRQEIKAIISDLKFKENRLSINKISLNFIDNAQGEITNLQLVFNFNNLISHSLLSATINIDKFAVNSNNNEEIINTKINGDYALNIIKKSAITKINLEELKSDILADKEGANLPSGQAVCLYKTNPLRGNKKRIDCKLAFEEQAFLTFNGIITNKNIEVTASATNIPLMIYQTIEKIIPNNPVISYLQQNIKSGYIHNGEISLKLNRNFVENDILEEEALKGNLYISNFEYKYHEDLPPLKNIDTNIVISGPNVKFVIKQAYTGATLISNGILTFKWLGPEKSQFILSATAKGEAKDLVDFIPIDAYENTKAEGIDLKKIKGEANSIIEIIIPLNSEIPNIYNISSILTNISLDAFNGNIFLRNAEAKGIYQDNKISFSGKGKINNYTSSFTYNHNMAENNNECALKIKTNIMAANQKLGIFKLISGSSVLNFEYNKQQNIGDFVTISSNLNNLEFYIDKISIHKKLHKKANLTLKAKLNNNSSGSNIEFNLSGEDNLKIIGNSLIKNETYNINLPVINYAQTNLSGKITMNKNNLSTELKGTNLDLSDSNMLQFLEKEGDPRNMSLKASIGTVKLKNNVTLNNLDLKIKCDKIKCFSGSLSAAMGDKKVQMSLVDKEGSEQWQIDSDDAGRLLKGIGMYTNMKNGNIQLTLNTRRQEVRTGQIIPILDGRFTIKRFVITDTPFLTRIVSFVSLPGFISFVLNNKDVLFDNMIGKFSYNGDIITLYDAEAQGPFFDFTMKGNIDTKKQQIKLKGNVTPSFFLISTIITKIPVLGKIFSKVAPYSLEVKY
ncbi:DUF3971 domain-containing protein [Rickettsia endosymbiont of Halotydeus destructor]|uniref:YhdP family protein n=1 Tax=Rickettsia endosymbiont of Halotydeus destructor TaxID=2996754 RepID=UPI003BAE7941